MPKKYRIDNNGIDINIIYGILGLLGFIVLGNIFYSHKKYNQISTALSDEMSLSTRVIQGPTGPMGPMGPMGLMGPMGPMGPMGSGTTVESYDLEPINGWNNSIIFNAPGANILPLRAYKIGNIVFLEGSLTNYDIRNYSNAVLLKIPNNLIPKITAPLQVLTTDQNMESYKTNVNDLFIIGQDVETKNNIERGSIIFGKQKNTNQIIFNGAYYFLE